MDRDRMYAIFRKMTPHNLWIRPMTKFLLDKYKKSNLVGVELGVDYGINVRNVIKMLSIEKMYLVDPYDQTLDGVTGDIRYASAQKFLSKYNQKIQFIRKKSTDAINDIPNNLDFVYIDGNHKYELVKKDIELYYPKVASGGIIGGHDFWGNETGVCKAAIEFAEENNFKLYGNMTDWWIIK